MIEITKDNYRTFLDCNGFPSATLLRQSKIPNQYLWCSSKSEVIYAIINNRHHRPYCTNPNCNKSVNYKRAGIYYEFCSIMCSKCPPILVEITKDNFRDFLVKGSSISSPTKLRKGKLPVNCFAKSKSEYVYCLQNDIDESPKCDGCGGQVLYRSPKDGYKNYCSVKCMSKSNDIQNAKHLTMVSNGHSIPYHLLDDWKKYCYNINKISSQFDMSQIKNYHLRSNSYHLDHKFSKIEGFNNNILPLYIGHIANLEILTASQNCSKSGRCSLTQSELFNEVDSWE